MVHVSTKQRQYTDNTMLNGEKLKEFPLKSETRQERSTLPSNVVLKVLARALREVTEIKRIQKG